MLDLHALLADSAEAAEKVRIALDELDADAGYLFGRVAQDPTCAALMAEVVRRKVRFVRETLLSECHGGVRR